jgi:hypothetical protein
MDQILSDNRSSRLLVGPLYWDSGLELSLDINTPPGARVLLRPANGALLRAGLDGGYALGCDTAARLVLLWDDRLPETLLRAIESAVRGKYLGQQNCPDPDFYVEGSVQRWPTRVRVRISLCRIDDHVVTAAMSHDFPADLGEEIITREAVDRFLVMLAEKGLHNGR